MKKEKVEKNTSDKSNKKKIIKSVLMIVLLIMVLGTSYALWSYTYKGNINLIEKYGIDLEFFESSDVISLPNAIPISDKEGKAQEETFDFQVKTTTKKTLDITYGIYIEKLSVDDDAIPLTDNKVKIYLTDFNNNELVAPTLISNLNNYILYTKTNSHSKTNEEVVNKYKLRIWMDENLTGTFSDPNEKIAYSFKLGVKTDDLISYNLDRSGANVPVLSKNMIPVYYDETCNSNAGCWEKADSTNTTASYKWYDYDNKMWANSVTVSSTNRQTYLEADPGTEIPMTDILTMQVWIPRYKYTVWNYNADGTATSNPQQINIQFESGTTTSGEIECTDNIQGTSDGTASGTQPTTSETCIIKSTGATCTDSTCNGKTYTHPAFTFGDKELTGFWVGKFEVSSDTSCSPENNSAIGAGCNLTTIKPLVKPNVTSWRGAMVGTFENNMMAMNDSDNIYGFVTTDDTHMIKNMEWGAVTYLSHSKYGINKEIELNSYNAYMTGCGPQSEGSTSNGSTCNAYNTSLGQSASTTGNIYGVYDMHGGAIEYVMGNMVSPNGNTMMSGYRGSNNQYSGYTGIVYYGSSSGDYASYTGSYTYPSDKYYDKYSFTSSAIKSISKLGDGIREVLNDSSYGYGWYDRSSIITDSKPWFIYDHSCFLGQNVCTIVMGSNTGQALLLYSSKIVISQ